MNLEIRYGYNFLWKYLYPIPERERPLLKRFIEYRICKREKEAVFHIDGIKLTKFRKYKIVYRRHKDILTILIVKEERRNNLY